MKPQSATLRLPAARSLNGLAWRLLPALPFAFVLIVWMLGWAAFHPNKATLPPVGDEFRDGEHYVAVKVDFILGLPQWGTLHWTAILDVDTLTCLYVRPHVDDVTGVARGLR